MDFIGSHEKKTKQTKKRGPKAELPERGKIRICVTG